MPRTDEDEVHLTNSLSQLRHNGVPQVQNRANCEDPISHKHLVLWVHHGDPGLDANVVWRLNAGLLTVQIEREVHARAEDEAMG